MIESVDAVLFSRRLPLELVLLGIRWNPLIRLPEEGEFSAYLEITENGTFPQLSGILSRDFLVNNTTKAGRRAPLFPSDPLISKHALSANA
jgi:hypothetical protein